MCKDCGCSAPSRIDVLVRAHDDAHTREHDEHGSHTHTHEHHHHHEDSRTIDVQRSVFELNDHMAMHNRERFGREGVFVVNLMSSPGAGKTRLLERTLDDLSEKLRMAVITGDLQTDNDARRLSGRNAPVLPLVTGTMCHLEAGLVGAACQQLDLASLDVIFIENVGNLVCPASFDLGENTRVVLMSVTEGEDKPLKYPPMFKSADVVLLTKIDLIDAADFDRDAAIRNVQSVAPQAQLIEISTKNRVGLADWYAYLLHHVSPRMAARATPNSASLRLN
jgi:hydrogenase nickel incorporation protein HypB